eukprot:3329841-Alexandrium_andersonii.AAC.1
MGARAGFTGRTFLPFVAWAFSRMLMLEDVLLIENTAGFKEHGVRQALCEWYDFESAVFSPVDLG